MLAGSAPAQRRECPWTRGLAAAVSVARIRVSSSDARLRLGDMPAESGTGSPGRDSYRQSKDHQPDSRRRHEAREGQGAAHPEGTDEQDEHEKGRQGSRHPQGQPTTPRRMMSTSEQVESEADALQFMLAGAVVHIVATAPGGITTNQLTAPARAPRFTAARAVVTGLSHRMSSATFCSHPRRPTPPSAPARRLFGRGHRSRLQARADVARADQHAYLPVRRTGNPRDLDAAGTDPDALANPLIARMKVGIGTALAALPYDLAWATTWGSEANHSLAAALRLPELPVVKWPDDPAAEDRDVAAGRHWKTRPLVTWAAGRPFAGVDDEITARDQAWVASHHPAPALLHRVNAATGLTDADIDRLARWATDLGNT